MLDLVQIGESDPNYCNILHILFLGDKLTMDISKLVAMKELSAELTPEDIIKIRNVIGIPAGLCERVTTGTQLLTAIKRWKQHNPYLFYLVLQDIRPDMIAVANRLPWLCASAPSEFECRGEELSIKSLIELLKREIKREEWELIYMHIENDAGENMGFEMTMEKLLENEIMQKELIQLADLLKGIQREDVVKKLEEYKKVFSNMQEGEFESKFKNEIYKQRKEMAKCEAKLKQFALMQYGKVQQMIGSDESVSLSYVYIELTILKQKPRAIKMEDETTYNEIAYLRKIANKQVEISPVDFTAELISYKPTKPEIWCLIGNPGCGKTFLAKRTALRFSSCELVGIHYSISVPCRNTDWHAMESTRYEENKKVESEFIQNWLCLGLPVASDWSIDLAKHLHRTDGEGLLLIIDGLDEFTKKVSFKDTFMCLLLTRQTLIQSTIILTSRPGAWTDISSSHELKIDRYYQVLGFSPKNRDLYFKKQITNEVKQKACWDLMERHDEMKQLSLIPVNASLFAALLKGEDSTSINTLTKLYYELTLYMIRRELSRMNLQEFSRVALISDLHTDIQECLKGIGFIAFLGVANRDLASEENVPLIIGQEEYPSNCLGLAHEHYRSTSVGLVKKVWTFAHLTMQEFTAAHWLSNTTWTEQCYSIRYISHSNANFSLFRMVIRFLCGLLRERAAAVLTIMHRHLTPQPIKLNDMPMTYQLRYEEIYGMSDWYAFTEIYFQLIAILYETNTMSITSWFKSFKQFFPKPIYLYIREAVSPNEWICFIQSLKLASQIQFIRIDTANINTTQFNSLIQEIRNCSVKLLALYFYEKDSTTVLSYTEIIRETEMKFDTKISIELSMCNFSDDKDIRIFPRTFNQNISCLRLYRNTFSCKILKELTNELSDIQYLSALEYETNHDTLLPALCQATQLKGLYLHSFPEEHLPTLQTVLPQFSELQEIRFDNYSLLPAISNLSNLTYLQIRDDTRDTTLSVFLLQIIIFNRHSLRGIEFWYLDKIGFNKWSLLLNCLEFCTNLVQLKLWFTTLPTNNVNHWSRAVNKMNSLVELVFYEVLLYDTGLLSLCEGLTYHLAIRRLELFECKLTSLSCDPITHLIPTVSQMERLRADGLSEPDGDSILLLKETANEFCIDHDLA